MAKPKKKKAVDGEKSTKKPAKKTKGDDEAMDVDEDKPKPKPKAKPKPKVSKEDDEEEPAKKKPKKDS